jgi:predicted ester cyclase
MADASANKAVIQRIVDEMWTAGNEAVLEELISADLVEHGAFATGGAGREEARQTVARFRAAFPDLRLRTEDMVAEGDYVVLRWVGEGTHDGEFMGAAPTGIAAEVEGIDIYRVVGGQVVEHWGYPDVIGLAQQLGIGPPPG